MVWMENGLVRIADEHGAKRVEKIVLQIGPLSGVEPALILQGHWDVENASSSAAMVPPGMSTTSSVAGRAIRWQRSQIRRWPVRCSKAEHPEACYLNVTLPSTTNPSSEKFIVV